MQTEDLFPKDDDRPIDVFFAGTLDYDNNEGKRKSGDIISNHRKECVEIMESMNGYEMAIIRGKLLNLNDYNRMIRQSKVVVSPWGWGEPCYRDFEAILAGCILIKPLTNFVISACGIYEHGHCRWTKPDLSDLSNDIAVALNDFKASQPERINSREAMLNCVKQLPLIIKANLTI